MNTFNDHCILVFGIIAILSLWSTLHLRKRNRMLKQMLSQRTVALKQEQQKLVESSELKQNSLASMSHEILNPLNGILGITRLMYDDIAETEQTAKRLKQLYSYANHLSHLLRHTLDCASLESTQPSVRQVPFFAPELLSQVLDMHRSLAEEKGLQLKLELPKVMHAWIGDSVLLRQILINLISNAVKYTTTGGVSIALSYSTEGNTIRATFMVTDTGPGIPKDKQHYIFEKFTRLSRPDSAKIVGSGLGLAIAAGITRQLNGSLTLDPLLDSGTRFSLNLPFALGKQKTLHTKPQTPSALSPQSRPKILLADDTDFYRKIINQVLQEQGAEIVEVVDGRRALEALEAIDFDMALLDVNMPKLSGIDVVKTALSSRDIHAPTFVAVTAYANSKVETCCLQAGFDRVIQKPLSIESIQTLVEHARRTAEKATANADESCLNYLASKNGDSITQLQNRYREAFSSELDNLHRALQSSHPRAIHDCLHKLQGLAHLRKDSVIINLLDSMSTAATSDTSIDTVIGFCDQLKNYIETEQPNL